jgi:hypothetical protein
MQTAAAVRRSAREPQASSELGHALGHVEEALHDLSAGMARIARGIGEEDPTPGGVAWRLRTLHHALRAARDLCAGARGAAHQRATDLLTEHRDSSGTISEILDKRETIEKEQFEGLLAGKTEDDVAGSAAAPADPTIPGKPALVAALQRR